MTLLDRLTAPGPKRILSLDGGGVRGIISLCYLERLESILRRQSGRPDLRLCDYFDLIGGTSTGAIIGAALAIGMEVAEIKDFYFSLGVKAFSRRQLNPFNALYNARPLQEILRDGYGDIRLGDDAVRTGLCVIVKRADTRSTWPMLNHPNGQYYEHNGRLLLRNVVRASTAAPGYFKPEVIDISEEKSGVFVDGGVSMANNPALQLFLIATLKGFPFRWKTGEDSLMLISVGTGSWEEKFNSEEIQNNKVWNWAAEVPRMLIEEGMWQTELILQLLSQTPTPRYLDREIGDLRDDLLTPAPLFHYLRYDVRLEAETVRALGAPHLAELLPQIRRIDAAEYGRELGLIGELSARQDVRPEHFPHGFSVRSSAEAKGLSDSPESMNRRAAPI